MKPKKLTTDGHAVFCGKTTIAQSYLGMDGKYEVRILQGMPRIETYERILNELPEYARDNDMILGIVPRLFSPRKK
jgi:hypothetical protein